MQRDIERLTVALHRVHPNIVVEQYGVLHPGADDDGLWFISHPSAAVKVQVESSTGDVPFLVESDTEGPTTASTLEETMRAVLGRLGLVAGTV